jgi:hypothetical protein
VTGRAASTIRFKGENMKNLVRFLCLFSFLSLVFFSGPSCRMKQLRSASRIPISHKKVVRQDYIQPISLEDMLKDLKDQGNIVYNVPATMTRDIPQKVELRLAVQKSMEELKKKIMNSGLLGVEARNNGAVVTNVMSAQLIGDSTFQISPAIALNQSVALDGNTWNWTVTPLQEGRHNLVLKLSAIVQIQGQTEPRLITTMDHVITVVAPPFSLSEAILGFLKDYWLWILILLLAFILLAGLLRGQKPLTSNAGNHSKKK